MRAGESTEKRLNRMKVEASRGGGVWWWWWWWWRGSLDDPVADRHRRGGDGAGRGGGIVLNLAGIGRAGRHGVCRYFENRQSDRWLRHQGRNGSSKLFVDWRWAAGGGKSRRGESVLVAQASVPSTSMEAVGFGGRQKGKKVSLAAAGLGGRVQGSKSKRSVDEGTSVEGRSSVSECQSVRDVHVGQKAGQGRGLLVG